MKEKKYGKGYAIFKVNPQKGMGKNMNNLELQKMANEVRKGIITAVHAA